MKNFWCCFLFFILSFINAQNKITKKDFIQDSLRIVKSKLIRPQFRFDNRITFLNNQKLSVSGLDAGILLMEKLRVTLGYYSVSDVLTSFKKTIDNIDYSAHYNLDYGALNFEFIYKNTRFFSLGLPVEFGFGNNQLNYLSTLDAKNYTGKQSGLIIMTHFGLSATFKPIRWIGLKVALGYRKTLFNQINGISFDGIYTSIGLAVDIREIIKDVRMYKLKKRYRKKSNLVETAIDLITD